MQVTVTHDSYYNYSIELLDNCKIFQIRDNFEQLLVLIICRINEIPSHEIPLR